MTKSFNVQKKSLKLTGTQAIRQYLVDKRIKIIKNTGGHSGYGAVGDVITFDLINSASISTTGLSYGTARGNTINFTEFTVITALTKEELLDDIKKEKECIASCKENIDDLKAKIDFLKETNSKQFDENEYKAYRTLKLVDNPKLSTIEKARLISKLIG